MDKSLNLNFEYQYYINNIVSKTLTDVELNSTASLTYDYIIDYSKHQSLLKEKEVRKNRIDKLYEIFKD